MHLSGWNFSLSYNYKTNLIFLRPAPVVPKYCDIRVPEIQEMLEKIPTPLTGATCNEKSGWLPANFDDHCREILSDIIRILINKNKEEGETISAGEEEGSEYPEEV